MEVIALTGIKRISAYAERIYRFAVAKCHCVTRISEASSEQSIKDKERIEYYVLSFLAKPIFFNKTHYLNVLYLRTDKITH